MIKRSESKSKCSRRKHRSAESRRKRRLQMEGLERRELLAGDLIIPTPTNLQVFSGPRNIGAVQSFQFFESETAQESGQNDFFNQADVVPLGTGPGQQDTIDVRGSMSFTSGQQIPQGFSIDVDTFAVDLKAGDILDIATQGSAGPFSVFFDNGQLWFGVDDNQAIFYPDDSPLQNAGTAVFAQVIPEDGRYFISVAPNTTEGNYTIGLRVYRPVIESTPIGTKQILFVDFDGAVYPRSVFADGTGIPLPGVVRVPSTQDTLNLLGVQVTNERVLNDLIDGVIAEAIRGFEALGVNGTNGHYDTTGNPGDFGITVLNSRDHADPGFHPLVSRVILGGTAA